MFINLRVCFCRSLFTLLLIAGLSPARADLQTGLVSYWPLDTADAGATPDLAFGNPMTTNNAPTITTGQRSNAFTFNGTSQYLNYSHTASPANDGMPIYLAPGGFTVAAWVKGNPQSAANRTIFYLANLASTTPAFWIEADGTALGNKLAIFLRSSGNITYLNHVKSTTVVWDNTWHHIAFVDNKGSARLYVDGVLDSANFNYAAKNPDTFTFNSTSIAAQLSPTPNRYFTGSIDDVAIWERPLSQAEIQQVRTNGIPTPIGPSAPTMIQPWIGRTNALGDRGSAFAVAIGAHPITYQWFRNGEEQIGINTNLLVLNDLTNAVTNIIMVIASNSQGSVTNTAPLVVLPDLPPTNIVSGLISYWPLDVLSNTPATSPDVSSHLDLTMMAMTDANLTSGQFSNALSFDGATQYGRRIGGSPIYNVTNYTIAFWVNAGVQGNKTVYGETASGVNNQALNFTSEVTGFLDNLNVFIRTDGGTPIIDNLKSTRSVFNSTWHHIVWTDQNGTARLYIDGQLDETEFSYPRGVLTLNTTTIGALIRTATNAFLSGMIDDVATWNRKLTYSEIQRIRTNGIPLPSAPTITGQPASQTNAVFAGDTVTFSVVASGDLPLVYRWRSNNIPISLAANASAGTTTLFLTNVQPAASANYSVIVTNSFGATTSSVAQLLVTPYTPQTTGMVLNLDWGLTGTPDLMPGFTEMNLGMNGTNFNGVKITVGLISPGNIVERHRVAPLDITNVPPLFTQAQIYNDLVANDSAIDGAGMTVLIERLAPNTKYGLTVWSWSTQASLDRISDWVETASGAPVVIRSNYVFNTPNAPTNDFDRTFGALLTSSPSGTLQLEGYKNGGTGSAVFVNGLRLVAQPQIRITKSELVGGNIRLTIETQYPEQPISIEQKNDLGGTWGPALGGGIIETHGPYAIAEFALGAGPVFYRVSSP